MTRAFIGHDNIVDRSGTTFSSADFVATLPVGNIAHPHLVRVARATGSSATLAIDAGAEVEAAALGIFGHNLSDAASVSLEAQTSAGNVTLTGASISTLWCSLLRVFDTPVVARNWRLSLSDPTVERLELGRVFLGPLLRPAVGVAYPLTSGLVERSERKQTLGGQVLTYRRPGQRRIEFAWEALSAEEAYDGLLSGLDRSAGGSEVLFAASGDQSPASLVLWGRLEELGPVEHAAPDLYRKRYRMLETL